jgi:hypothetical protein
VSVTSEIPTVEIPAAYGTNVGFMNHRDSSVAVKCWSSDAALRKLQKTGHLDAGTTGVERVLGVEFACVSDSENWKGMVVYHDLQ